MALTGEQGEEWQQMKTLYAINKYLYNTNYTACALDRQLNRTQKENVRTKSYFFLI